MAGTVEISKAAGHVRSNSLPSRTHPLGNAVEEQLLRLRSSDATTSPSSALSVCRKLGGLKDLYDSVNDWLQLSPTQQVLSSQENRQCAEDLLSRSLQTLDVCGTLQEVLYRTKESLRELESSLRRGASANEQGAYVASRRMLKKVICKTLQSLKNMESKKNMLRKDARFEEEAAPGMLREAEEICISEFESVLCFLSRPKTRSNGWSLVSKVLQSKRISCVAASDANELEALDIELVILKSGKDKNFLIHNVQKHVEALESSIREIEEVCECVFRCLLKTRVSLLNILNH